MPTARIEGTGNKSFPPTSTSKARKQRWSRGKLGGGGMSPSLWSLYFLLKVVLKKKKEEEAWKWHLTLAERWESKSWARHDVEWGPQTADPVPQATLSLPRVPLPVSPKIVPCPGHPHRLWFPSSLAGRRIPGFRSWVPLCHPGDTHQESLSSHLIQER